jgi:acyl-CoA thioester hydrolase
MAHETQVQVRFYELDPYDHVNHAIYFSYFETARIDALASVGYDLTRLKEEGFHLVVSEVQARFRRPARYGETLEIHSLLVESKRVSSRWRQTASVDGEVVATLEMKGAITDSEGRPRRAPAGFLEAIEPLMS